MPGPRTSQPRDGDQARKPAHALALGQAPAAAGAPSAPEGTGTDSPTGASLSQAARGGWRRRKRPTRGHLLARTKGGKQNKSRLLSGGEGSTRARGGADGMLWPPPHPGRARCADPSTHRAPVRRAAEEGRHPDGPISIHSINEKPLLSVTPHIRTHPDPSRDRTSRARAQAQTRGTGGAGRRRGRRRCSRDTRARPYDLRTARPPRRGEAT